jgi:acyl-CoA synthetase (AMP-forming)/AMP-acid ligase II
MSMLLGDVLGRHARVRGAKTAYIVGDVRVDYATFQARAAALAHGLRGLGVGRGDRVAVLAGNGAEYPVVYFAVLRLGAIVVPVNARFAAPEVAHVLRHADVGVMFVEAGFAGLIEALRETGEIPSVRRVLPMDGGGIAAGAPAADVDADLDEHDPHVLLYTSGTTGSPKGALLSHRSYFLQVTTGHLELGLCEEDVGLSMFPMFHMGGWALPLGFWHTGGTVVIMPKADPRAMLETIARERVTYLYAVPTVFRSMMAQADFARFDLSSLRVIASGTSAMTRAEVLAIRERFGCPNLFIRYGSTEAGPVTTLRPADLERKAETVGRPALDVEVRLLGGDGRPVAAGEAGEVAVRSEFTMRRYWHNPDATDRTIRDGWVLTGDLGVFDDEGFLSIVGRCKEVIRSGGENVFPDEVERVLLGHPDVREAAVVGIPDVHWGESVVAVVVPHAGRTLTAEAVVAHVRERLAGFKKPRYVLFQEALPRLGPTEKVHRTLLRETVLHVLAGGATTHP